MVYPECPKVAYIASFVVRPNGCWNIRLTGRSPATAQAKRTQNAEIECTIACPINSMFRPCRRIFQYLGGRISNSLVLDNFARPMIKTYTFDFPTCTSVFSNTSFPTRIAQHILSNMSFPTRVFQHDLCPNEAAPMYKICVWLFNNTGVMRFCARPLVQNMVS